MSAPPLPEVFGNYALGEFVEVVSPAAISWLPQTVGWAWLGLALFMLAVYRGGLRLRHWYRNRYRREAVTRLEQLGQPENSDQLVAQINTLLKLTAMHAYPRELVASLYGEEWARFLNRQCDSEPFSEELANLLASAGYQLRAQEAVCVRELLDASRLWVMTHREHASV